MPTKEARVRSLHIRPIYSADLAFNTGGILDKRNPKYARLGSIVPGYDISGLLAKLRPPNAGLLVRLPYDVNDIHKELSEQCLLGLRNDLLGANLQQAMTQREVAYLEKFKHKDKILAAVREVYPADEGNLNGKLAHLKELQKYSRNRKDALEKAYQQAYKEKKLTPVVTETKTESSNTGKVDSITKLTPVRINNTKHEIHVRNTKDGNYNSDHVVDDSWAVPQIWSNNAWGDLKSEFQSQITTNINDLKQTSTTINPEFRHPELENQIRELQTQLELQDEILLHKSQSYRVPDFDAIMSKELEALDLEILKSQIMFVHTYLVSPIPGIVTAVYKDLGESVQPGEPVIRVENNDEILLVGLIQYRAALRLYQTVEIEAKHVFESNDSMKITGKIVSVRGHDNDDDVWDVIIECKNKTKLPVNYHFEREDTYIKILDMV